MSDYTPTTEDVRFAASLTLRLDAFDRWLAEVQRRAREEAWAEGFDAGEADAFDHQTWDEPCTPNPYRKDK